MAVFEIGGGEGQVFPGNYEDYLWRKEREKAGAAEAEAGEAREKCEEPAGAAEEGDGARPRRRGGRRGRS